MRLFVLGATGKTGRELLDLALARGHEVTAFARSPQKITRRDDALTVVKGDPKNAGELAATLRGHDAVLSALGPTPGEAMTHSTALQDCAASTVAAMTATGVRRLGIVSSAMLFPGGGPLFWLSRALLGPHVRDLQTMEARVATSGLDWTIARPPRLVRADDELYRARDDGMPGGSLVLSWRAVAAFLLESVEHGAHVRHVVGISR